MMTIYKFPLIISDRQIVSISGLKSTLSVRIIHDVLQLYAIVDGGATDYQDVEVAIVGTGNPLQFDLANWTFQGTFIQYNGELVWHVWTRVL